MVWARRGSKIIRNMQYRANKMLEWYESMKIGYQEIRMLWLLQQEDHWWMETEQPGLLPPSYKREHAPEEIIKEEKRIIKECRKKIEEL